MSGDGVGGVGNHYLIEHGRPGESLETLPDLHGEDTEPSSPERGPEWSIDTEELYETAKSSTIHALSAAKDTYFEPRSWERWRDGRLYELAGVHHLKKARGPLLYEALGMDRPIAGSDDKVEGIKNTLFTTYAAEAWHTPFVVWGAVDTAARLATGQSPDPIVVGATAINGYASMLQRYNRARAYNHLDEHAEEDWREDYRENRHEYRDFY